MEPLAKRQLHLRRRGRLTRGQSRALAELGGRYCLPAAGSLDPDAVFGRSAPLGLEIGFGTGSALVHWAGARPDWNLLGVEVYQPGIGAALLALERHGVANVRLLEAPAEDVLERQIAPASLAEARIFFPDPWPKKRHHKRRLIQPPFARLLASRLAPGGRLWLATDWEDYAVWTARVLDAEPELAREPCPLPESGGSDSDAAHRPSTRFETRGLRLGHQVHELRYSRKR